MRNNRPFKVGERVGITFGVQMVVAEVVEPLGNGLRYKVRVPKKSTNDFTDYDYYERNQEELVRLQGEIYVSPRSPRRD